MVSLALIASLIFLARQLLKELMKKEKIERVVLREEEMPELFHSPYGEKTHTSRTCVGLRNASYVSRHTPCSLCCPGGLRAKEARAVEYRRTFLEAAGKYLWLKVFLIIVIMVASWFMVFEVNHTFGFPLLEDRMVMKREAEPKNESMENASRHERSVAPVEEVPTGKSQEGDHVEMFTTWSQLHVSTTKDKQTWMLAESTTPKAKASTKEKGKDMEKAKDTPKEKERAKAEAEEASTTTKEKEKTKAEEKAKEEEKEKDMAKAGVKATTAKAKEKDTAQMMNLKNHKNMIPFSNGADVSLDAQGKKIKTEGRRMLNLTFFDQEGEVCRTQVGELLKFPRSIVTENFPLKLLVKEKRNAQTKKATVVITGGFVSKQKQQQKRGTEEEEVKKRGGMSNTAHLADALVHFSTQLGYNSMVLKADNENAAKAVKDKVQKIRRIFLGKTEQDTWIVAQPDGIHITRSVRNNNFSSRTRRLAVIHQTPKVIVNKKKNKKVKRDRVRKKPLDIFPMQIQIKKYTSITKLVPILALANNWAIYSVDVKDAFLQENFERSKGIPSLYRLLQENEEGEKKVVAICIVHVDDLQFAGRVGTIEPILAQLKRKVTLQVEGPFLKEDEYQRGYSEVSVRFLKRKYIFENFELKIYSDNKYSKKLVDILNLQKKKTKNSPCTPACQEKDDSPELDEESSSQYRTCVGILLYVAHDRPDIQFAVRNLSTAMSRPTTRKQKELEHLALYLKGTSDYSITYKKQSAGTSVLQKHATADEEDDEAPKVQQEHLLEVFSDSDWAGDKQTRKSVSCATFYINGAFFYSYSRTQKSIALSSAEAEYMALTGYCGCKQQFEKEEYQYMQLVQKRRFQSQRQLKHSQQVVLVVLVLVIVVMASVAVNFYVTENRNKKNKKRKNQKVNSDVDLSEYQAKKEELEEAKAKHKERLEKSKKFEEEEKKFKEKEKLFEEKEKKAQKEEEKVRKLEEAVKERSLDLDVKTKGVENRLKEAEKLERKAEERMSGLTVLLQPLP
ncbi:Retrovirus-related Pol polyprotein from transposon TNT 1-94 [Symbiodinium microadriaticum]|uniref:Retrovirus-related Pol polyprotein from transposon TNT 1-94 n=1 Tax=Symbiodinium microadriaticum TaxID=2951 RepID=A0A1Q9CYI7_SYMMI|nr:Retrovirus-related Pol polyprotein from transposon TNT 1-94 [Symbiodinium microadriaticum]